MESYFRCFANVNIGAIKHNISEVKKKLKPETKLLAVIKANAYGHGAVKVGTALENMADYFGVATIGEAVELRKAGIKLPILILGYTSPAQFEYVVEYDITQTIYNLEDGIKLDKTAERMGKVAKFHIAIDSGMTRIGFKLEDKMEQSLLDIKKLSELENAKLEGAFTHFSCADMGENDYQKKQVKSIKEFFDKCEDNKINIPIKHVANSAAIMEDDSVYFNMVRSGIITYGLYPSEDVNKEALDLIPAMEFKTHVVNIEEVKAGVGISYGATYVTEKPMKVATLAVGYADGYKRALSNKGRVLINGEYAPILGRVCMDQMMVDVTNIKDVKIEDIATLFGRDGDKFISVEEIANMACSFNYEYVCSISERVKRIYIGE